MKVDRISTIAGLLVLAGGLLYNYAQQMERLNELRADVAELKAGQTEIMKAIGVMENRRWREQNKS